MYKRLFWGGCKWILEKRFLYILISVIFLYGTLIIVFTNQLWNRALEKQDIEQAMKNNDIVLKKIDREMETLSLLTKDY